MSLLQRTDSEDSDFINLDIPETETELEGDSAGFRETFSNKVSLGSANSRSGMTRNSTYVWASGRPNVNVVVTGVAAAVPGRHSAAFKPGVDSIQRIIAGENFITPVPLEVKVNSKYFYGL
jgi:hypothetical protein